MAQNKNLYIGVMSGTSLDGIDIILIKKTSKNINIVDSIYVRYSSKIRNKILKMSFSSHNDLEDSQLLGIEHAKITAKNINKLLNKLSISFEDIAAIGYHGQTVRHCPEKGFSIQIGNAHFLAEITNINVVADFRGRDIAAGGEGAPLVPTFHDFYFSSKIKKRVILNIGGISNLTFLNQTKKIIGFDCGPGNILMDHWILKNKNLNYDKFGSWAKSGRIISSLLSKFLNEPYFKKNLPKSCGREIFNLSWIHDFNIDTYECEDVQRTLLELTVLCIKNSINRFCVGADEVYVCGGGSENQFLMERLKDLIKLPVMKTEDLNMPSQLVESAAFAWLASKTITLSPSNSPEITGSKGPKVLGVIYYA